VGRGRRHEAFHQILVRESDDNPKASRAGEAEEGRVGVGSAREFGGDQFGGDAREGDAVAAVALDRMDARAARQAADAGQACRGRAEGTAQAKSGVVSRPGSSWASFSAMRADFAGISASRVSSSLNSASSPPQITRPSRVVRR
jgi:hypothetical protein